MEPKKSTDKEVAMEKGRLENYQHYVYLYPESLNYVEASDLAARMFSESLSSPEEFVWESDHLEELVKKSINGAKDGYRREDLMGEILNYLTEKMDKDMMDPYIPYLAFTEIAKLTGLSDHQIKKTRDENEASLWYSKNIWRVKNGPGGRKRLYQAGLRVNEELLDAFPALSKYFGDNGNKLEQNQPGEYESEAKPEYPSPNNTALFVGKSPGEMVDGSFPDVLSPDLARRYVFSYAFDVAGKLGIKDSDKIIAFKDLALMEVMGEGKERYFKKDLERAMSSFVMGYRAENVKQ